MTCHLSSWGGGAGSKNYSDSRSFVDPGTDLFNVVVGLLAKTAPKRSSEARVVS